MSLSWFISMSRVKFHGWPGSGWPDIGQKMQLGSLTTQPWHHKPAFYVQNILEGRLSDGSYLLAPLGETGSLIMIWSLANLHFLTLSSCSFFPQVSQCHAHHNVHTCCMTPSNIPLQPRSFTSIHRTMNLMEIYATRITRANSDKCPFTR